MIILIAGFVALFLFFVSLLSADYPPTPDEVFREHRLFLAAHPEVIAPGMEMISYDRMFTTEELRVELAIKTGKNFQIEGKDGFTVSFDERPFHFASYANGQDIYWKRTGVPHE